jgi:hypothetical protein
MALGAVPEITAEYREPELKLWNIETAAADFDTPAVKVAEGPCLMGSPPTWSSEA